MSQEQQSVDELTKYQPKEFVEHYALKKPVGVRVHKQDCRITNIQANSGLTGKAFVGDTIVAVDGQNIANGDELHKKLKEPTEKVVLKIRHCSWSWCCHLKTTVEKIQMDKDTEKITGKPVQHYFVLIKLSAVPECPSPPIGLYIKYDNRDRLQVASVEPRSMAAVHVRAGDVIRACNGKQQSSKTMLNYSICDSLADKGFFTLLIEAPISGEGTRDAIEMAPDVLEMATKQIEDIKKNKLQEPPKSCFDQRNRSQKHKLSIATKEKTEYIIVSDCDPSKLRPCKHAN